MTRRPPEGNDNADWGRTVETAACERFGLERVSGGPDAPWWFDARVRESVDPDDGFGVVASGTLVEVKSAAWRIDANGGQRRGRWLLRERAHRKLAEAGGEYALAVRDVDGNGVAGMVLRPAWWVEALLSTWSPAKTRPRGPGGNGRGRRVAQVPWSRVFREQADGIRIVNITIQNTGVSA